MDQRTDQELLRDYAGGRSEAAFSEVVRRHLDLVYSAAFRLVGNAHLAEDVSQRVFLALAQNAERLAGRAVLSGWLHCTAHNISANVVRADARRQAREQEAALMNQTLTPEPDENWEAVAPYLDTALNQLNAPDRDAVLLRYFERKTAREIAQRLGISAEAAQKRVNRGVERLRELFAKRGIAIGAGSLTLLLTANAVSAAPSGMALTISGAVLPVASLSASTTMAATKMMLMTTLQKTLVTTALLALVGAGIYQTGRRALRHNDAQVSQPDPATMARNPSRQPDAGASAPQRSPVSSQKAGSSRPSGGFTSTELYALLTTKNAHLTRAQVEPYLSAKGRNAASLLAAFRTTGDPALLREALQKFRGDPHVGFEAAIRSDAPQTARRAGLDAFKQAAPENALANYLSALDYMNTGHKAEAVEELNAAAAKPYFQDYGLDRIRADEEVYLAAGYPPGEAQMIANTFLQEPQLVQVVELGKQLVGLAGGYQQAGDQNARDVALQMAIDLGHRVDDPSAGEPMRWQLIGIRVERAALAALDPASPFAGTSQSVQDRLNQLASQMTSIQSLTQQADPIWKTLSDQEWSEYHRQMAASTEEAAVRWLVSSYGQR